MVSSASRKCYHQSHRSMGYSSQTRAHTASASAWLQTSHDQILWWWSKHHHHHCHKAFAKGSETDPPKHLSWGIYLSFFSLLDLIFVWKISSCSSSLIYSDTTRRQRYASSVALVSCCCGETKQQTWSHGAARKRLQASSTLCFCVSDFPCEIALV